MAYDLPYPHMAINPPYPHMAFNNAHHFGIDHLHALIVQNPQPSDSRSDEILHLDRAAGATHKSSTSAHPTKCHPETRKEVIADVAGWVEGAGANEDSSLRGSILWLSGPAGAGKTCIMRSIADRCETRKLSVASYFFSARGSGLTSERPFVATIVHRLTISHPDLKKAILDIIRGYPTIFDETLDSQMDRLLVRPLQPPTSLLPPSHKVVIAIDGLDECSEEHEREHLLDLLHTLVTALPRLVVVIIASRPEFDLRRIFNKPKLSDITKVVQLQEYDGKKDVRVFLRDEFEEIRQSHPLRMLIQEGWPLETTVQLLVDKSSGQFALPSAAAKYIKKSRRNPVESLDLIVGLLENPSHESPFTELDALYSHILHPPNTDFDLMKRILHCLLGTTTMPSLMKNKIHLSPIFFDVFLGLPPDTTTTTLCELHSLISVSSWQSKPIELHHQSLEDYLLDPGRSQDLFQAQYDTHLDLTQACAMQFTRWDAGPAALSFTLHYASDRWAAHLSDCIRHKPTSTILPDIVLNMDPRIDMKYRFFQGTLSSYNLTGTLSSSLHEALCSERHCVRLCQLVSRMQDCLTRCQAFSGNFGRYDYEERSNALPRFSSETGLYTPLDPDSRTVFDASGTPRLQDPPTLRRLGRSISPRRCLRCLC